MKKILISLMLLLCSAIIFAQPQEVLLTVSGQGNTEEEAINNALRLAVEEAYGVFVSTNTEILNDEIVKDEIATVTSGNIKSFNKVSSARLSSGIYNITLETIVSISALRSYAASHGGTTEFNGAVFGANVKLFELNKRNTRIVLDHLMEEVSSLSSNIYNYSLKVSDPKVNGDVDFKVSVFTNNNYKTLVDHLYTVLSSISIEEKEVNTLKNQGVKLYKYEFEGGEYNTSIFYLLAPVALGELYEFISPMGSVVIQDNLGNEYPIWISDTKCPNGLSEGIIQMLETDYSRLVCSTEVTENISIGVLSKISSFKLKDKNIYPATSEKEVMQRQKDELLFKERLQKQVEQPRNLSNPGNRRKLF